MDIPAILSTSDSIALASLGRGLCAGRSTRRQRHDIGQTGAGRRLALVDVGRRDESGAYCHSVHVAPVARGIAAHEAYPAVSLPELRTGRSDTPHEPARQNGNHDGGGRIHRRNILLRLRSRLADDTQMRGFSPHLVAHVRIRMGRVRVALALGGTDTRLSWPHEVSRRHLAYAIGRWCRRPKSGRRPRRRAPSSQPGGLRHQLWPRTRWLRN